MSDNAATTSAKGVAIVTGAAQGIGKAIALRLSRDGFSVVVNDLPSNAAAAQLVAHTIKGNGRPAYVHLADVSNEIDIQSLVSASVAELGPLAVMVANAGISEVIPLLDLTSDDVRRMCNINIMGVFHCFQAATKQFIAQGSSGKLVAAASVASHRTFANLTHYSATKFAVRGLVQGYAQEFAKYNITANGYCPGITDTPMLDSIDDTINASTGGQPGDAKKNFQKLIALDRLCQPEDIAKVASFLSGPDSDYLTGQNIVVDGGIFLT